MANNTTIRWLLIALIVIAGLYLVADHGQHLVPYLPFTFLLGCLVMHLFMHAGHGNHKSDTKNDEMPDTHNHH